MKRRILPLLLALALVLCGCGQEPVYTTEYNGVSFTVDTETQTITQGDTVYGYEIDQRGNGDSYTITYPDGATYTMTYSGNSGAGGGSGSYYDADRLDGSVLIGILRDGQPRQRGSGNFLAGVLCLVLGVLNATAPYAAWYISRGWYYKDAEPSEGYLTFTRIGGVILIIGGVLLMFIL